MDNADNKMWEAVNKGNVEVGKKKQKNESGLYICLVKEDCEHSHNGKGKRVLLHDLRKRFFGAKEKN